MKYFVIKHFKAIDSYNVVNVLSIRQDAINLAAILNRNEDCSVIEYIVTESIAE